MLTWSLTTDVAATEGGSGDDTFNALIDGADNTLNAFDSIDGSTGTDTLKIAATADVATAAFNGVDITSVEKISVAAANTTANDADISLDTSDYTSIVDATLRTSGNNDITYTSDVATTVSASVNHVDSVIALTLEAAKTVSLTSTVDNNEALTIDADVLATLNVNGFAAGSSVTLGSVDADVDTTTLTLNVTSSDVDFVDDDADIETLTVKAVGDVVLALDAAAATAVSLTASGDTTLADTDLDLVETLTIAGAGDITADLASANVLETVTATTATGALTLTLDNAVTKLTTGTGADVVSIVGAAAATASYNLGAGNDSITIDSANTNGASINGSTGTDTIVANGALGTLLSIVSAKAFTGFEQLGLGDASTGTLDMSRVSALGAVLVDGDLGGAVTLNNAAAGTTLAFTDEATALGFDLTYNLKTATGTTDSLAITVGSATGEAAIDLDNNSIIADDIENISIASLGSDAATDHTIQLEADALEKLTVTGSSDSLVITYADATLETIVAGSFAGDLDLDAVTLSADGATVTTGAGDDDITSGAGDDVINAGAGDDVITLNGGTSEDDVTGGAGSDTFIFTAANAIDGTDVVNISDFEFGEDGDVFTIDDDDFTSYATADGIVTVNVAIAEALGDLDAAATTATYVVQDTEANLAGLDISAATAGTILVFATDTGNLYALTGGDFADAALIGTLNAGTFDASNLSVIA